jgi:energy-coupling factor transporter ATP-binding protein EcfA2
MRKNQPTPAGALFKTAHARSGADDPRTRAFCQADGPEVFHSVEHRHEIARPDPFDVEWIHAEAREAFERLLHQATAPPGLASGRILLLRGESGSGKTHLLRAFRNLVHRRQLGYCAYMQMTSQAANYGRYILSHLIDSLEQPYLEEAGDVSGLVRLANALAEIPSAILPGDVERIRDGLLDDDALARHIAEMTDFIRDDDRYQRFDLDLVRALFYLHRDEQRVRGRALKYLRCEDLAAADRRVLGDLVPRRQEHDPERVVGLLGRLIWSLQGVSLVFLVDQLEEMFNFDDAETQFRRAMATLSALADEVPSSVVVISCLDQFYTQMCGCLTRSIRDRIEQDPEPIILRSQRTPEEIEAIVGRRLMHFFEALDVAFDPVEPLYPLPPEVVPRLSHLRARDVLDWCRTYRQRCIHEGRMAPLDELDVQAAAPAAVPRPDTDLQQVWNDWSAEQEIEVPENDEALAVLLARAIVDCSAELGSEYRFRAQSANGTIDIERRGPGDFAEAVCVGLCNKRTQGGALSRQIEALANQAGGRRLVLVRSTEFPKNATTKIARQIGVLIKKGGNRVVVEDSDWRTMLAFQTFQERYGTNPGFSTWLCEDKPVSRLRSVRTILALDSVSAPPPTSSGSPPANEGDVRVREEAQSEALAPLPAEPLLLGHLSGLRPDPVHLNREELTRHAAFLGGSGSGKTTLALNILEQLLAQGIPVLLVDRKGDLCGYGRPEAWSRALGDGAREAWRDQLRRRLDVTIFTPGNPAGRPLSIPLVPNGMSQLDSWERGQTAGFAAFALGGMLGYKDKGQDASRIAIMRQAINLLATLDNAAAIGIDRLINFIDSEDPVLLQAIGQLDAKLFKKLVQDLETLRLNKGYLFAAKGEPLDTDALFGFGNYARPGKTRLSIISTKFLGDNANIEFWVAQLLLEIARWSSKHPLPHLQAVILFDEADLYLPAQRKPATKEPMENLLKRARSAGVALFLASQSPGDFDYKCRDNLRSWFLGRITQQTSLAKMKPILSDYPGDLSAKLPSQQRGQFLFAREGQVTPLSGQRSLIETEQLAEEEILSLAGNRQ